jgi:uncharacterized protein YbjT (DUF2867 family)
MELNQINKLNVFRANSTIKNNDKYYKSMFNINKPEQYTILVSGATGQQGGAVARHLLNTGFKVRALTRNPGQDAAQTLSDAGAEIAEGNFYDSVSLSRALEGAHGAFSVQNSNKFGVEEEIKQGKAFADAAGEAGVKHFVYTSVGGAERNTGIPHFDSKWEIEEYVRSLDLPATILRPVYFMNNWLAYKDTILDGRLPQPLSPETPLQQIAVDDIGAFAAIAFSNPDEWIGQVIEIAGDELTMRETAETFSHALNRDVKYVQVPWNDFKKQAGDEMTTMYRWFEDEGYKADIEALRKIHHGLKDLQSFLREKNL